MGEKKIGETVYANKLTKENKYWKDFPREEKKSSS